MRTIFFAALAILSPVLILDWLIQLTREPHNRPTDCADEDVPVIDVFSAGGITMIGYRGTNGEWIYEQK